MLYIKYKEGGSVSIFCKFPPRLKAFCGWPWHLTSLWKRMRIYCFSGRNQCTMSCHVTPTWIKDKGEGDEFTLRAISPPVLNERVSIVYQQAASAHFYLFIVTTEVWLYRDEEMKKMRREWWKMISTSHSVSVMQELMGEIGWNNFSLSVSTKFCDQRCEGYLMQAENLFKCWVGIIKLLCILFSLDEAWKWTTVTALALDNIKKQHLKIKLTSGKHYFCFLFGQITFSGSISLTSAQMTQIKS